MIALCFDSNPNSIGSNVICRARSDGNGNWNSDLPKTNEEDADGDPDSDFSSSPDPETVQKMEQQAYEQLAFNLARLLLLQQVKDTSLQQLPVARLQQLIRVDCNESPATPTANETEPSIPGSGHGLSHAIKAVLRFPIKSTKIVAERRFDDIRQSEVESEVI